MKEEEGTECAPLAFRVPPLDKRRSESLDTHSWLGLDSGDQQQEIRREEDA